MFLSLFCLSFSEINLGKRSVSHSFRQTPKHMVLWVGPLLGAVLGVPGALETAEVEPEVELPCPPKGALK